MVMLKKRRKKKPQIIHREVIWCEICKTNSVHSNDNVVSLVCGDCFAKLIYREELAESKSTIKQVKHPRGWALKKKYKASDGKVYSFGVEVLPRKRKK